LRRYNGTPYVAVIGVHKEYRGRRRNGERPGDAVLRDALAAIGATWPHSAVLALVDPNNDDSCELFRRNGFEVQIEANPNIEGDEALFGLPENPWPLAPR
jgi:ribosomal protein S18 acetylase RimI-like enzyme